MKSIDYDTTKCFEVKSWKC